MLRTRHTLLWAGFGLLVLGSRAASGQTCVPCDVNCNGTINTFDIQPFIALLSGGSGCSSCAGDVTCDGSVNAFDINGFVECLTAGSGQPCPEAEGTADLDVDSDNTNGTSAPDRGVGEELIEDDPAQTGKFVLVNNDDDDHNGTPDKDQDGAISAEQDDLVPIVVELTAAANPPPANLNFKLTYPASIRIWKSATRGNQPADVIASGVAQSYATAGGPKTFWVEGLTASTTKADVEIVLDADTDNNGSYEKNDAVRLTVVSLNASAASGGLGTPITWTLNPAITPVAFATTTTAAWSGVYKPLAGNPTGSFAVSYSASQLRESSAAQAVVVVGDGQLTNPPNPAALSGGGTLLGQITFQFSSIQIRRAYDFAPASDAAKWATVEYPDGPGGNAAPQLAGEPTTLELYLLSALPDGGTIPQATLLGANDFHLAAVVRTAENASSLAAAPSFVAVDLVSYNQAGLVIDRLSSVLLFRDDADGDPAHITFHSDLGKPVIFTDLDLNKPAYPGVLLLKGVAGGSAAIVPAGF